MFATSKRGFKAQSNMKTLLEIALMLIVYAQIYPELVEPNIETAISNADPIVAALLSLLPFLIVAMIIIGVFSFNAIRGRR